MKNQMINFLIYQKLLEGVDSLAKKKSKSRSALLREAVERMLREEKEREEDFSLIESSARRVNLSEGKAITLIEKVRDRIQINQ